MIKTRAMMKRHFEIDAESLPDLPEMMLIGDGNR